MSQYRRKQAWEAGVKAAREGKPATACNRQRGTIFYDDWHDAYEQTKREMGQ